ncbi:MAG: sigma-54-dependent Fis family transcriptional regulator [Candidatus Hydrogenedentes bacterium]|nr:sigma-54-dependent Fis family transcriptional regulator [Candidatus Hydrogenedentota bacterium]
MSPSQYLNEPVLLVDDEDAWLRSFSMTLRGAGIANVHTCNDSREALKYAERIPAALVVLDLTMPHFSGVEVLRQLSEARPDLPVVMLTGLNDLETAVACMKEGAFDFFVKTTETERLVGGVKRALELQQLRRENLRLRDGMLDDALAHPEAFADIVSVSQKIWGVFKYLEAVSASPLAVLITGETGVGKELFARAVHNVSGRPGKFVPVNAAGLDEQVFSDTLFGHVKGAFTGADGARSGLIEQAANGTLFLDEIGDLDGAAQVKLLRLLQEGEYYPLGSDTARKSDARIVAATNCDLKALSDVGAFRKDLFYRLHTHRVSVPPLRERREDIGPLLECFLDEAAEVLDKKRPTAPRELVSLLKTYHFPGNVRELKSMVMDAVTHHAGGVLSMARFKEHIRDVAPVAEVAPQPAAAVTFGEVLPTLKENAELLVEEAMRRADGNQAIAAEMLGISRQALNKRLKQS